MTIPRIMVIQQDQTQVALHYRDGAYRQLVTLLTVFNPQCLALNPKDVSSYEEIAPYARHSQNLTWLLVGLSLGVLTNVYGTPEIWPYAFVIFTFALATLIFRSHHHAKHMLYQLTLMDGRRIIVAIEAEYTGEMKRQFSQAKENRPDGLHSDNLNPEEQYRAEKIKYGLVTASASASLFQMSRNISNGQGYADDLASMLSMGIIVILIGLIGVSIGKMMRTQKAV